MAGGRPERTRPGTPRCTPLHLPRRQDCSVATRPPLPSCPWYLCGDGDASREPSAAVLPAQGSDRSHSALMRLCSSPRSGRRREKRAAAPDLMNWAPGGNGRGSLFPASQTKPAGGQRTPVRSRSLGPPRAPAIKAFQEAPTSVGGRDPSPGQLWGRGREMSVGRRGEAVINGGLSIRIFPLI